VAGKDRKQHRAPTSSGEIARRTEVGQKAQRTNYVQNCASILPVEDKLLKISNLELVEAAGVEPAISVENTQLTDFENASNAENATISKSTVQSLYEHCLKFPELQPSDFPAWCKSTLKRFCSISDVGRCKPQGNGDVANLRTLGLEPVSGEFGKVGK